MPLRPTHPARGAFAPISQSSWARATYALGAHVVRGGVNFAVYSRHATHVLLEIFAQAIGDDCRFDYWMQQGRDGVWRARLRVPPGTLYGFRCWGPNWSLDEAWTRGNSDAGFITDVDVAGHRFNPNKLLFDPYARELSHDRETPQLKDHYGHHAGMYGSGANDYDGVEGAHPPVVRRDFDT
jgi:glycogen operon protein